MANQPTKYKKFVATAATATLVASAIVPVASAATPEFSDITGYSADVQAAINALAAQGIINGTSATTFEAGKEITRGQVVKLLGKWVEAKGAVAPANWKTVERFTDLPVDSADQELLKYAAIAYDAGVFQGNNKVLNASGKISRENMALVLDRAYDKVFGTSLVELAAKVADVNVADLATAKTEAQPAIQALKDLEISVSANFNPKGNVTRANFATFLYRALNIKAAVESVSAINTTTVTAKLATAKTGLVAKDFKVLVDGTEVTPSAVVADATGANYTFTVASLDGKAGKVSVNGTEVAYDFSALKVLSVSAINAKEIKVVFNQKVTTATAEWAVATAAGAITVKPTGGAAISVTSKLAADGLSATLTLDGVAALANATGYDVTVGTGVLNEKGEGLKTASTSTFQFNDKVKPTVTSVQSVNGDVVVNFSEKLAATATTVVINGQSHSVTPTAGATKVTVPKANFTGAKELEAGKSYTVVVAGATDYALNAMDLYSGSVTYAVVTDTVAPTVSSVTVNNEKTFTVVFSEEIKLAGATPVATDLGLTLSTTAAILGAPTVTTTDNKTFKVVLAATPFTGISTSQVVTATFAGFKDAALNLGTTNSQQLTFTKDSAGPKFASVEYNATTNKVTLTFDEELAAVTGIAFDGKLTIVNNATGQVVTPIGAATANSAAGVKTVVIDNAAGALNLANGSYTFSVASAAVTDTAFTPNNSGAFTAQVNITGSVTVKPTVTSALANVTNEITVTYATTKVKGGNVAGSATDASNYKLNGKALPTGTVLTIDGTNQIVKIQLPAGSIDASTTQILTISGVQALGATATIDTLNTTVTLTDTKAPVITGAAVNAAGNLVLTFSENVVGAGGAGVATTPVDGDFIIAINGVATTATTDYTGAAGTAKNQVVISPTATTSFATGTITVKATGTTTGKDAAGNSISVVETVTATR